MHFGNRCGFVRNELQAMLANDTVESRISKRHVCSVAQPPFDRGGGFTRSACSREHARVEIEADNLSCRTDLVCYESGHNARPHATSSTRSPCLIVATSTSRRE